MSNFNPSQVEELKRIGSHLRQERELRSLTIEDISADTFVRPPLLTAIETGEAEKLPEVIYVQGFIRRYGDFLGLDGNALAHQLSRPALSIADKLTPEMVALPVDPNAPESLGAVPRDRTSKAPSRPMRSQNPLLLQETVPQKNFFARVSPYWLSVFVLIAAIAGFYSFWVRPQTQSPPSPATSAQPETKASPTPIASVPSTNATPASGQAKPAIASPSPLTQPTTTPTTTPLTAQVKLTDRAWLKVEADGKKIYEGVLDKGSAQTWTASKTLKIRSGNAGAVNLSVNQAPAKPLGNLGEVKEIVLDAQSSSF